MESDNCFTILLLPDEDWLTRALEAKKRGERVEIGTVIYSDDPNLKYKNTTTIDNLERFVGCTDLTNKN